MSQARPLQFEGKLADMPLPEVLATIGRYTVPGTITANDGIDEKRIFIADGQIIFASSSNRYDSLGEQLLRKQLITSEQLENARAAASGGKRQGTILVEMRALSPKDLFIAVREQVQSIVWSVFEWVDGTVAFRPGETRTSEFIKIDLPVRQAVMQGVRHMREAKRLIARMGNKATLLELAEGVDPSSLSLAPEEEALLRHADGRRTLYELTSMPPLPPAENARILYAFFALQLIQVKTAKPVRVHVGSTGGGTEA